MEVYLTVELRYNLVYGFPSSKGLKLANAVFSR